MELYAIYESAEERKNMIALESAEIALDRALLAYDAVRGARELNIREAELRCVMESGDACTLMDFYEEAKQQTEEKEKGLLATIWDKIIQLIQRIKKALGIGKKKDDEEYAVSSNTPKAIQAIKNLGNSIKQFLSKGWSAIGGVIKTGLAALAAIVLGVVIWKKGKPFIEKKLAKNGDNQASGGSENAIMQKGSQINAELKTAEDVLDDVEKVANAKKNGKDDSNGESGGIFKQIISKIKEFIDHLKAAKTPAEAAETVTDAVEKGTDKVNKVSDQVNAVTGNGEKQKGMIGSAIDKAKDAANGVKNLVNKKNNGGDQAQEESAEDFGMTKDFAELLASDAYTEAADEEELAGMLAALI
jgi:hypothetical protein